MKLNSDCIRDILLAVEEECTFNTPMEYKRDNIHNSHLLKYNHEEIIYHIKQCELAGLITKANYFDGASYIMIHDLTPDGHKFIANIREDTVWNGVKSVARKVGSTSLSALTQIASNVISELIKAQFGLNSQQIIS